MAKLTATFLKFQEDINYLLAKLWFRRKESLKKDKGIKKGKETVFVNPLPDISEEEKATREDYRQRLSMAMRIMERGYPPEWANGVTRISVETILKEYEKILTEKKTAQKINRIENLKNFVRKSLRNSLLKRGKTVIEW